MAQARSIDFNKLPRSVRERLIAAFARQGPPYPAMSETLSGASTVGWVLLILLCGAVLLGLLSNGYGRAYDSSSVEGPGFLLVYVAAFLGAAYSIISIIRRKRLLATLPFKPGRYLLPMDFVDARDRMLRIVPMATLVDLSAVHHHTNGVYTHTLFTLMFEGGKAETFTSKTKAEAEAALATLKSSRAAISEAVTNRDADALASLDPFFTIRIADAWENPPPDKGFEPGPMAGEMEPWLKQAALIALVPALTLAPLTWFVRNRMSDESMFKLALEQNTEEGFEEYLRYGKRHGDEVRDELLWKAALDEAKKAGTSAALEGFVRKYPDSPASNEVKTDTLPRLALKEALAKGTVSAVREFLTAYPGSVVDADAHAEIHKLFSGALGAFRAQASTADPKMLPFIERLLKYLEEKESPPVLVTFKAIQSPTLELADKLLQKQQAADAPGGITGLPGLGPSLAAVSPHFSDERSQPREQAIVTILQGAFATIFPADVLPLKEGPRRTGTPSTDPVTEPCIEIDYVVGWSGSTYSSESSGREFVGIKFDFQAAMRIPGESDKDALRFKLNVAPPDHFTVNYFTNPSPFMNSAILGHDGPTDEKVYEVMAARAFDELSVSLRGVFFKEGSSAFEPPKTVKAVDPQDNNDNDDDR